MNLKLSDGSLDQSPEQVQLLKEFDRALFYLSLITRKELAKKYDDPAAKKPDESMKLEKGYVYDALPGVSIGSRGYIVAASRLLPIPVADGDPAYNSDGIWFKGNE